MILFPAEIITLFLFLAYAALLVFYRRSWRRMPDWMIPGGKNYTTFISVIIPARNEEENIARCLRSVLQQTYPQHLFEIIVVDDFSTDKTAEIVQSLAGKNIRLLKLSDVITNQDINSYKKKTIESGIHIAHGSLIVTTDADCIVKPGWLEHIAAFYEKTNAVFIAAPVSYLDYSKNDSWVKKFLNIFQSLDFISLQGITGASVQAQFHNMCNGANLAYERKVFYAVNGFAGIDSIASGDDMLLMHKIAKKFPGKIKYLKSTNGIVYTKSAETIGEFLNQRIRWASKASVYPDFKITAVLFLVYFVNVWMMILAIASFFSLKYFYVLLAALIDKIIFELFFLIPVSNFFQKQKLLWWFIPSQPFHIIYTIIAGLLGKFGRYTWKGRRVK